MDTLLAKLQVGRIGKEPRRLDVLIAYEDAATQARAEEFCHSVSAHFGPTCQVTQRKWLLNELRSPQLRLISATEAAASDLVVLALHCAQEVPEEVRNWVELWLAQQGRRCAALIALFDAARRGDSSGMRNYLAAAAGQARVEFIEQAEERPD